MKMPSCPVCQRDLESLGSGNVVKPFWTQIGRFFLYPANTGPIVVMLVLILIGFVLKQINGFLFGLGFIVLYFMFIKYCMVVLEDTAHGYIKPRPVSSETLTEEMELPFKLFLLQIAMNGIIYTAYDVLGPVGAVLAYLFFTVAYFAMIMVLAMEHSFFKALNPLLIVSVMTRIGFPYFILVIFLYILSGAGVTVFAVLSPLLPKLFLEGILVFAAMYFMLVMYTMMGYVLYQYHDELGYEVEVEAHEQEPVTATATPVSPELRAAEILIQEGKNEEAARRLEQIARDNPADYEARERLLKLLRLNNDHKRHLKQGQELVSYLLHHDQVSRAAKVVRESYEFDRNFKPAKAQERLTLARFMKDNGQGKLAVALANNLHRDFPNFDGIPEAYLLVAQVLSDKFNQDDKAEQILNFILNQYPDNAVAGDARQYLEVVKNLRT
jgi:tetratricopeptide (TPR) repeat protein